MECSRVRGHSCFDQKYFAKTAMLIRLCYPTYGLIPFFLICHTVEHDVHNQHRIRRIAFCRFGFYAIDNLGRQGSHLIVICIDVRD